MEEIWKDIPKYLGYYQASNKGNIRSIDREISVFNPKLNKKVKRKIKGTLLKQRYIMDDPKSYKTVNCKVEGTVKQEFAHRLVAMAFIDNPENKPDVNHIDGNKSNNTVENLEWVTKSENMKHAKETGLYPGQSKEGFENFKKQERLKVKEEK